MRTQEHDDTKPVRFRAATLSEAVQLAEQSLGARTRVVEANQLRRGGIGGFFASDLGVEISVVVEDETVDDALERMVDEVAAEEREQWRDRAGTVSAVGNAVVSPDEVVDDFAAALRAIEEATEPSKARVVPASPELSTVTAETISPAVSARPWTETQQEQAPKVHEAPEPSVVAPVSPMASRLARLEATVASLPTASPMPPKPRPSAPTQRQVELVVAAAEQLMETVVTRARPGSVTVRVVMRNSEGAEVEAFAGCDNRAGDNRAGVES